jgi:pimeloyl-ACP methyl ester carboxylesterase
MSAVEGQATEGYAAVNGVGMYWRSTGTGGVPLVLVHGGFGLADMFGDLLRRPYDWTDGVRGLTVPALLVYGDADSMPPSHAAEFFALLGGGLRDGGWDGAQRPAGRLAVLPGRTRFDVLQAPELAGMVASFLA